MSAPVLLGAAALSLRVRPVVAFAPAAVRIFVTVEPEADNRTLEIVLDSGDYYRSSSIPLDGSRAPRVSVFEFPQLPTGTYAVMARLDGLTGERATETRIIEVVPEHGK